MIEKKNCKNCGAYDKFTYKCTLKVTNAQTNENLHKPGDFCAKFVTPRDFYDGP